MLDEEVGRAEEFRERVDEGDEGYRGDLPPLSEPDQEERLKAALLELEAAESELATVTASLQV